MTPAPTPPRGLQQALEQRLRSSAKTGAEFARKRQLLVFDRTTRPNRRGARRCSHAEGRSSLGATPRTSAHHEGRRPPHGGFAGRRAREAAGGRSPNSATSWRSRSGRTTTTGDPETTGCSTTASVPSGVLAGKLYSPLASTSRSRPGSGEPEVVVAEDVLAFAGIAPPTLRLYPIETHRGESCTRAPPCLARDRTRA